jgi:iron complex transport system substrate-binding protein
MAAGNWVPELVELAGGKDLFGKPGEHSGWIEWNALESLDPERIILMPCGFDLQRTQRESLLLQKKSEWRELRAVKTGQVFATDGNAFFNRPGPRLVESFEILVEILHPEQKRFGHRGRGWEVLQ